MPIISGEEGEKEGLVQASKLMLISARTAPKSGDVDDVITAVLFGEEKEILAKEMDKIAEERKIVIFQRDAKNVRDSEAIVLLGVRGTKKLRFSCGACGYTNFEEFERVEKRLRQNFLGPTCIFKALDLGIALGSAVKTSSILTVNNRECTGLEPPPKG